MKIRVHGQNKKNQKPLLLYPTVLSHEGQW